LWILIIVLRAEERRDGRHQKGKKKRGQKTLLSLSPLSLQKKENAHPHALIREAHTKKHDGASIAFKSKSNKKNRKDRKYTHTYAIIIIISSSSSSRTKN